MLEALLSILHPQWARHLEVPIYRPVRGVIDLVLAAAASLLIATELQSEMRRLEQQIRWSHQKADGLAYTELGSGSGGRAVSRLLILRSTVATRELAKTCAGTLRTEFPARTRDAYAALTGSDNWPGPALLWACVEGTKAAILDAPPRGIDVGR